MKSGSLNFLEPSGPLQACNGTALPLLFTYSNYTVGHDGVCRSGGIDRSILTPGTKQKRAVIFIIRHGNRPETLDRELGDTQRLLGRREEIK